jgi:hypothetical protein
VEENGWMRRLTAGSAWWSRARGLPQAAYAAWKASLAQTPGRPARILAWAKGPAGFVVGSPAALSWGGEAGWSHVGWHEIEHGGWNAETATLSWTLHGGRRGSVGLDEPARLPELFRERIAATIALERFVPVVGDRGVIVTARRDLGDHGAISWHSSLTRGLTWHSDGVQAAADRAMAELRSEYDLR